MIPTRTTLYFYLFLFSIFIPIHTIVADTIPAECAKLYALPTDTMQTAASAKYLDAEVCQAQAFLIARYSPGPASSDGLANPRVDGILKLNTDFVVRVAKMLKSAPMQIGVISAYRSCAGQLKANPTGYGGNCNNAPHTKGIAVDLSIEKSACDAGNYSDAYKWILGNAKTFNLGLYNSIHRHVPGECNHIEPITQLKGGDPIKISTEAAGTPDGSANACSGNGVIGCGTDIGHSESFGTSDNGPCSYGYSNSNNTCIQQSCSGSGGYVVTSQEPLTFSCSQNQLQSRQNQNQGGSSGSSGGGSSSRDSSGTVNPISSIFTPTPISGAITPTATTSASDFLNNYLNNTQAPTNSATSSLATTTITLNSNQKDIVTLNTSTSTVSSNTQPTVAIITSMQPIAPAQTFNSSDLQGTKQGSSYASTPTFSSSILTGLHSILLKIAQYLSTLRK